MTTEERGLVRSAGDFSEGHAERRARVAWPRPLEHVCVAADFSPATPLVVARAARLPVADNAKISLIHVLSDALPRRQHESASATASAALADAEAALADAAHAAGRDDIRISSALHQGLAHAEIVRRARSAGAQLLVLGRHGHHPVKDMLLGSTAERVVRVADIPVLVVGGAAAGSYLRPLVAVDLEDASRAVAEEALRVVGPSVETATMVHAYRVPFEGFMTGAELSNLRKEYEQRALLAAAELQASLAEFDVRWQTCVLRADARLGILEEALRHHADLLAVGTHGRGLVGHALLGSVAEWVIRAAVCDVLVARPSRVSFGMP